MTQYPPKSRLVEIYTIGAFAYFLLCLPAIGQRGFPPIDPIWTGVTFLWMTPILIAAVFDHDPFPKRIKPLVIYCLATAFFDVASLVTVVPKRLNAIELAVGMIFFGPIHLVVGFAMSGLVFVLIGLTRKFTIGISASKKQILRWMACTSIVLLSLTYVVAFRQNSFLRDKLDGQNRAELDWNKHDARIYVTAPSSSGMVSHYYDSASGLELRQHWPEDEYSRAYNARIEELLKNQGVPDWSVKKDLVEDSDLSAELDSETMEEITTFPHDVNPNIVLFKQGTIERFGGTLSSRSDSVSIGTRFKMIGGSDEVEPIYVGRSEKYPNIIFIRNGKNWVGAFHTDGRLLSAAYRFQSGESGKR